MPMPLAGPFLIEFSELLSQEGMVRKIGQSALPLYDGRIYRIHVGRAELFFDFKPCFIWWADGRSLSLIHVSGQ